MTSKAAGLHLRCWRLASRDFAAHEMHDDLMGHKRLDKRNPFVETSNSGRCSYYFENEICNVGRLVGPTALGTRFDIPGYLMLPHDFQEFPRRRESMVLPHGASVLERGPKADLWRNTLSHIPTTFGRLLYLHSLRDPDTRLFYHFGLMQRYGRRVIETTLRHAYKQLQKAWRALDSGRKRIEIEKEAAHRIHRIQASWDHSGNSANLRACLENSPAEADLRR
jgi:hypothetical protein